jgi:hypothetical protein
MLGRRKVIASRHRRPISLPPRFGFLVGLEHLDHFAGRVDGAEHHGGRRERPWPRQQVRELSLPGMMSDNHQRDGSGARRW